MTTTPHSPAAEPAAPARHGALLLNATILASFLAASAAPTPLYRVYQQQWGFSPAIVTIVFGVYAFSLLAALLTVGKLSDHIGRRPVIFAALLLDGVAMLLFIGADAVPALIAARIVQGFATGAATSALGAALIDHHRHHGPLVNSVAPMFGMALGALGSSALVVFAPEPMRLVYAVMLATFAVQAVAIWWIPESAEGRPGALASLRPTVSVPAQARGAMLRVTPVNIAVWALGGFFLSLVPGLVQVSTGETSSLVGGAVVAALTLSGAASILGLRQAPARTALAGGTALLLLGIAGILAGVHSGEVVFLFAGTVVAGLGFGAGFLGCVRSVLPLASAEERAGLLAAFYVQSYLAFSLPAMIAGATVRSLGLVTTTDVYTAALVLLAVGGLASMRTWRGAVQPAE